MKKILLTLLGLAVVLGLFAATGYAGYRIGYAQGAQQTMEGPIRELRAFGRLGPNRVPMQIWGDRFDRGLGPGRFLIRGFGVFVFLRLLAPLFLLALIALFVYWLFTRSGWQFTRAGSTVQATQIPPPAQTEVKEESQED